MITIGDRVRKWRKDPLANRHRQSEIIMKLVACWLRNYDKCGEFMDVRNFLVIRELRAMDSSLCLMRVVCIWVNLTPSTELNLIKIAFFFFVIFFAGIFFPFVEFPSDETQTGAPINKAKLAHYRQRAQETQETSLSTVSIKI